jgi:GTP 3',8-cyclase
VTVPVRVPVSVRGHYARPGLHGPSMPLEGPLLDRYGRIHDDLRISVTDRCNLRCIYCMPEQGISFMHPGELLTFDEIIRVAFVARGLGVTSVRITGGEPLLRKHLPLLVARLSALGFHDVAMTTNAMALARLAGSLAEAGLNRVNVSCDSLRPDRFASIRRRGALATVLGAMEAAEAVGLTPLKVNVVLMRDWNDDEILNFAAFARTTGRIVRFIEFMPLDAQGQWQRARVVAGHEVLRRISERWPLEPVLGTDSHAPVERYRFSDGHGEVGVISSVSNPFCGTCNRLRLTADGALRNCLYANDEVSIRDLLRRGGSDQDLALSLRRVVWDKHPGHGINEPQFLSPQRSMSMIGG